MTQEILQRHLDFMELAKNLAWKGTRDKTYRFGTILVKRRKVLSVGINRPKDSHTMSKHYRFHSVHAEVDCLIGVPQNKIPGTTMYVYRFSRGGKPGISKPCELCEEILRDYGVRDVYYLDRNAQIQRMVL